MCGISGLLSDHIGAGEAFQRVRTMTGALHHRGPDGEGLWGEGPITLGHRRLAVLDLTTAGAQPMQSSCGRYVVTLNGEIYNHRALRQSLARTTWQGHSDTEVLVEAISAWGLERAIARIEGMFAVGVWDRHERVLWLVRDRMGEKPLYYGSIAGHFVFASELRAFHAAFPQDVEIDTGALPAYLRGGYVPAPGTIYRGIAKLPAAHLLRVDVADGRVTVDSPRPYWHYEEAASEPFEASADLDHAAAQLDALLTESIAERVVSDVPLGAFLSGGIDSSLIVALMARISARPVRTFSIAFPNSPLDETTNVDQVVAHLRNVEHCRIPVDGADALATIPELASIFGEPFADPSELPTLLLARGARRHVTVALTGDGADELFGGYHRYLSAARMWGLVGRWPRPLRNAIGRGVRSIPVRTWDALLRGAHLPLWNGTPWRGDQMHKASHTLGARDAREFYDLVCDNWRSSENVVDERDARATSAGATEDFLQQMMTCDLRASLPDGILTKVDRVSMAVGLETRAPYLAEKIVRFAARLPIRHKIAGTEGKRVLRRVVTKYLPADVAARPKMGFQAPLDAWLRAELRPWAEELLRHDRLDDSGFDAPAVRERWREHASGARDWQYALWPVLMWQSFVESQGNAGASNPTRTAELPPDMTGSWPPRFEQPSAWFNEKEQTHDVDVHRRRLAAGGATPVDS